LAPNTQYYYRVQAANYAGASPYSPETNMTTLASGTPMPLDALKIWLKADCGYGGNPVNYWADQTTNGNGVHHLYSDTNALEPAWVTNAMNGRRAMYFGGTNSLYFPAFGLSWTQAEIFVAIESFGSSNSPSGLWLLGDGAQISRYPDAHGEIWDNLGVEYGPVETPVPSNSLKVPHLYNAASLPNSWSSRINNTTHFSRGTNAVGFNADQRLGWSASGYYFSGYISELMLFNRGLTDDERSAVAVNYLRRRFDLWQP
jgi:hypothetical protein